MSRLPSGGRIARGMPLRFAFDGESYTGFFGDTLASALIANNVRVVGHSVTYGRPRGIFSAGVDEPNALVDVKGASGWHTMLRATQVQLAEGLEARSLKGKGRLTKEPDDARYHRLYAHCDVLVIGGGPAGLAAAVAAGHTGARVIVVDEQPEWGGSLLGSRDVIDDGPAMQWVAGAINQLHAMPEARLLSGSTATGLYDQNYVLVVSGGRLWEIRARQVVLATGAIERSIAFADNDRPGIMLAGAVRTYINRYAALPGRRAALFTNNDSAYACALDLADAGVEVQAIVDARPEGESEWRERALGRGIEILPGEAIETTYGGAQGLESVIAGGRRLDCDLLGVSGGFNPTLQLFTQARGRPRYDNALACFVPSPSPLVAQRNSPSPLVGEGRGGGFVIVAGSANGEFRLSDCLRDGSEAGARAAFRAGFGDGQAPDAPGAETIPERAILPYWTVPGESTNHFVDLERDVTVADLYQAVGTGMQSIEHVKRFTTLGTGSDQGKTSGVVGSAIVSALLGRPIGETGTTTHRPPYVPVSFALWAGRSRGDFYDPIRVTSIHPWHVAHGAVFENVGQWKRPWYFPRDGEGMEEAVRRECRAVRQGVGVMDVSTLGKIDIQGPDALTFVNRIYTNAFDSLEVGRCRYGVMCRLDGMVFDDGVVMHLGPDHYLATTTTGNAGAVMEWMEEWLQTEWTDLRVRLTSVTEHWATIALVGPHSRAVLESLAPDLDTENASFPFMAIREGTLAGIAARLCRISFSGELAFEINVPSYHGLALWEAVMATGEPIDITPYGTEALHVLRAEKGYIIVGQETDGTVTPQDLGMSWIVSSKKEFIGRRSHRRPEMLRSDRRQLVGLLPERRDELLPEGGQLSLDKENPVPLRTVGHVTSSYYSPALGRTFALALLKGGRQRMGETVYAPLDDRMVAATVTEPIFYDREGRRRDG